MKSFSEMEMALIEQKHKETKNMEMLCHGIKMFCFNNELFLNTTRVGKHPNSCRAGHGGVEG